MVTTIVVGMLPKIEFDSLNKESALSNVGWLNITVILTQLKIKQKYMEISNCLIE